MLNYVLAETRVTLITIQKRSALIQEESKTSPNRRMGKFKIDKNVKQDRGELDITYICEVGKVRMI